MITGADEYPFHQTPDPMAFAGTDRNFYDRFFFNGYSPDGEIFFAVAFGLYPQLGIMDGAVCVLKDGKQHNVRVSRRMDGDRSVLEVGPLSIHIEKPLERSRIVLAPNDSGITVDLTFIARHPPIEEPRFIRRNGTRAFMDVTRMTQNVGWLGTINIDGETIPLDPAKVHGTRDRSWGIRPVGAPDPQPPPAGSLSQFFWVWTPTNFENHVTFAHTNDDEFGRPWNRRAGVQEIGGALEEFEHLDFTYEWVEGTRRVKSLRAQMKGEGSSAVLTLTPEAHFYMSGLGYTHPVWGHGRDHGGDAFAYDVMDAATDQSTDPLRLHIQAIAAAELAYKGATYKGHGVVEQLFIGPHQPTGMGDGLEVMERTQ